MLFCKSINKDKVIITKGEDVVLHRSAARPGCLEYNNDYPLWCFALV